MIFDIKKYKGKYAMHCKTEEEAKSFCNYLHEQGRKWTSGSSYKECNNWNWYREATVYDFNTDGYCGMHWFKENNYTILEWEDFMKNTFTKADLKTGDIIRVKNGKVGIVNGELGMIIFKDGWENLDKYSRDLMQIGYANEYDIVAVRRPKAKSDCQFKAFQHNWGTLVYERKDVEEMTLEQVCQLLGKKIKIIK